MVISKTGFWLALVGGILGLIFGILTIIIHESVTLIIPFIPRNISILLALVLSLVIILTSFMMLKEKNIKTGSILVIIFSIFSGNILSLIGGIVCLTLINKKLTK